MCEWPEVNKCVSDQKWIWCQWPEVNKGAKGQKWANLPMAEMSTFVNGKKQINASMAKAEYDVSGQNWIWCQWPESKKNVNGQKRVKTSTRSPTPSFLQVWNTARTSKLRPPGHSFTHYNVRQSSRSLVKASLHVSDGITDDKKRPGKAWTFLAVTEGLLSVFVSWHTSYSVRHSVYNHDTHAVTCR